MTDEVLEVLMKRLRRRLVRRDKKIVGLRRKVADLESALAMATMLKENLPRDVTRAVQAALSNVRMIPIHGLGGHQVVEVIVKSKDGP